MLSTWFVLEWVTIQWSHYTRKVSISENQKTPKWLCTGPKISGPNNQGFHCYLLSKSKINFLKFSHFVAGHSASRFVQHRAVVPAVPAEEGPSPAADGQWKAPPGSLPHLPVQVRTTPRRTHHGKRSLQPR